ncbi:hypothetical protein [Stratiformator vulcanicus]|uniref:Uncharacterized protein n=1 Tax=Stratiformator vulcanicus TaxID=2527980 RepID=A0A517QY54_9PLAN|nr:hypothetical protein [Stratiformator vulcanicus]QDT36572.1 hypothetical protein Pan189_09320 [Stratiformator vulcanicus]
MQIFLKTALLAAFALPLTVGCAQQANLVRGQNPPTMQGPPTLPTPAGYQNPQVQQVGHWGKPSCDTTACGMCQGSGCNSCQYKGFGGHYSPCPICGGHGCKKCMFSGLYPGLLGGKGNWMPDHKYSVSYKNPGNLVYPPGTYPAGTAAGGGMGPGTPGAMVQYPYFTPKGPDDFFLDKDGIY